MRVHHLNCGTNCPMARRLGWLRRDALTCHCLAIESRGGLVLVDTGFGQSARNQLAGLGFGVGDVSDIVLTHLDFDHAGGLMDFPLARVHVYEAEYQAALHPRGVFEHLRYQRDRWAHGAAWVRHRLEGESWLGFAGVRALGDILLVPLVGHTRGHCGVAVPEGPGWLLHAGDAYFSRQELVGGPVPWLSRAYAALTPASKRAQLANLQRLQELQREHGDEVRILCSHDREEFGPGSEKTLSIVKEPARR